MHEGQLPGSAPVDWWGPLAQEVADARSLLDFAIVRGVAVSEAIVAQIEKATRWEAPPVLSDRVTFELAYRDLAQLMEPVTAATLRFTDDDHGRPGRFLRRRNSEAKIWSHNLGIYTVVVLALILGIENLSDVLQDYFPTGLDSSSRIVRLHIVSAVLQSLEPFLYGALGSLTYLIKSAHTFIHSRSFDKLRIPEYYNRLLLGTIAGGAIKLLVTEVADEDGQVIELSAATLAFIAGYNNDFLFSTIERITAAIFPKVELEPAKHAGPDGQTSALVQNLLERLSTAGEDERQSIQKLLDRLVR